ncbi:MAG TPA: quinone-dependent dihydroorotate dehydrogenase [Flavitalea sp.]|nr:quinone-dependent dihydroorotate dehydrogenase [Flavitalea sp.]
MQPSIPNVREYCQKYQRPPCQNPALALHWHTLSSHPTMYKLIRKFLFLFPTESVHYFSMNTLKLLKEVGFIRRWISQKFTLHDKSLATQSFGIRFPNPVGLGAGFDKNARYLEELEMLGFGFVEIGTVTPKPQGGNEKPRLFRLPEDKALINRMGFNNDGVKIIAARLKDWKLRSEKRNLQIIIGGNIGKNKMTPNEEAWKDYEICFQQLIGLVDYFVVNVSSPNTPGLRELQEKDSLRKILSHLQTINAQQLTPTPLLLKIAPDLTDEQLNDVIELAMEIDLDGIVASNTTINRQGLNTPQSQLENIGAGGLSGKPVRNRATEVVRYISTSSGKRLPIIASGGIFTGEDAVEKLNAGASLIQVWTGFVYQGPSITKNICQKLLKT